MRDLRKTLRERISKVDVIIVEQSERIVYGLWMQSEDRTVAKDIPALSARFYAALEKSPGDLLPFYVVTKDYDEKSKRFQLFIGGEIESENLEPALLPEGAYCKVAVRPKFGFLWGAAVGAAKRDFYTKWLPRSGYRARNLEYELHTEKSISKRPEIDLLFAVEKA